MEGPAPSLSGSLLIFEDADEFDTGGDIFEEAQLDEMMARLDAVMNIPATLGNFERETRIHFWRFSNRLQQGRLAPGAGRPGRGVSTMGSRRSIRTPPR